MAKITKKKKIIYASILVAIMIAALIFILIACGKNKDKQGNSGVPGKDGADGLTPNIGENGNWWIGGVDTGICAAGKDGYTPIKGVDYFDGIDGINGVDGKDGAPGKDGESGKDGEDGINGIDGKDAVQPQIMFDEERGVLHISYDDGMTWSKLLDLGDMIKDVQAGVSVASCKINSLGHLIVTYSNGDTADLGKVAAENGKNGKDGVGIADVSLSSGNLIVSLSDGTVKNLGNIHGADGVGISDVTVTAAGNLVIKLTNGKLFDLGNVKGNDGVNGLDGINGTDGKNGSDGITPTIRIDAYTKEWQVSYDNGESWQSLGSLSTGSPGEDGISPVIRIDANGYWEISRNNGLTWENTGVKAVGKDGADGEPGEDGRGIASMEIIDGYLFVTYTDSAIPVNIGKVGTGTVGGGSDDTPEPYTDGLVFYPLGDGSEYGVAIGAAIYMESIVIPSTYHGKPVTTILDKAFAPVNDMESVLRVVIIPNSVIEIRDGAFSMCEALENVFIPSSVQTIGIYAFEKVQCVTFEIAEHADWNEQYLACDQIVWNGQNNQ